MECEVHGFTGVFVYAHGGMFSSFFLTALVFE